MTHTETIQPQKWYSIEDVVTLGAFPWANSRWLVKKLFEKDKKGKNILKVLVKGKDQGTKYFFKGENITKFIKAVEDGKVRL